MARTVRVLLTRRVDGLGDAGSEHAVAFAYAQRVLLPTGAAVVANPRAIAQVKAQAERNQRAAAEAAQRAQAALAAIAGRTVVVPAKASGAKLYGSVDAAAIVAAAKARLGATLDPEWVRLAKPITTVGDHRVELVVPGSPAAAHLTVTVSAA